MQYSLNSPVSFQDPTGTESVGELIERKGTEAAQAGNTVATAGWAFAKSAWDIFGFEGVSKTTDASITNRTDVGAGDYALATLEIATLGKGGGVIAGSSAGAQALLRRAANATNRVFWSGTSPELAAKVAKEIGGQTLEMTWPGKLLGNITTDKNFKFFKPLWESASRTFAQGAKGPVTVVHGEKVRIKSVWRQIEYPVLSKQGTAINYRLVE